MDCNTNVVYLLLGSNLGNRRQLLNVAMQSINKEIGMIELKSSLYETSSWGFDGEDFLNAVIKIKTIYGAEEVLKKINALEKMLGRVRKESQWENRSIDIDILFYNQEIINTKLLIVPHPRLHLRRFTLEPLVEIASAFIHPLFNKTIEELLKECEDEGIIKKVIS